MNYGPDVSRVVRCILAATFRDSREFVKFKPNGLVGGTAGAWWLLAATCLLLGAARTSVAAEATTAEAQTPVWNSLFDGKNLGDWKSSNFGGEGRVSVADQRIVLDFGDSLTGIAYTQAFPPQDYEIRLEAMRVDGIDFFCGLTFPVGKSHCSLIVGGWAGALVGLSCVDGRDAAENETTQLHKFDTGQWYRIRVRVTAERIRGWIDERMVIDQDIRGRRISTRPEVDLSKPLGIAAWQTKAALRAIEYRQLGEGER